MGKKKGRPASCDTFLTIPSILERKAGKIQISVSCQFKFSKYAREMCSRIECWKESCQKEEMKMPTFSVQCCQVCPRQYGVKSLLGQQEDALSIVQNANSFCATAKRGPRGSHCQQFPGLCWSPPFLTLIRQFPMEVTPSFEVENTSF